jgi:hypothetical protein
LGECSRGEDWDRWHLLLHQESQRDLHRFMADPIGEGDHLVHDREIALGRLGPECVPLRIHMRHEASRDRLYLPLTMPPASADQQTMAMSSSAHIGRNSG